MAGTEQATAKKTPLGVSLNNPGNIEYNPAIPWQGQSQEQPHERFAKFDTPEDGLRAMAINLQTYNTKYGLNTPAQIIERWAPPGENKTGQYIASVAKFSNLDPNAPLSEEDYPKLMKAMIRIEQGTDPYSDEQIAGGWQAATNPKQEQEDAPYDPSQAQLSNSTLNTDLFAPNAGINLSQRKQETLLNSLSPDRRARIEAAQERRKAILAAKSDAERRKIDPYYDLNPNESSSLAFRQTVGNKGPSPKELISIYDRRKEEFDILGDFEIPKELSAEESRYWAKTGANQWLKNTAAAWTVGSNRLAGELAALPANFAMASNLKKLNNEDIQAYNAVETYKAMQADVKERIFKLKSKSKLSEQEQAHMDELIHARDNMPEPSDLAYEIYNREVIPGFSGLTEDDGLPAQTVKSIMDSTIRQRGESRTVREYFANNVKGIYNPNYNRNKLDNSLAKTVSENMDLLTKAQKSAKQGDYGTATLEFALGFSTIFAKSIPDFANNKAATVDYVVENLPQLVAAAGGGALMTLSNVGYAAEQFAAGLDEYEKEHGKLTAQAIEDKMLKAVLMAGAEMIGDAAVLSLWKKASPKASKALGKITDKIPAPIKVVDKVAAAAVSEALTEGPQTLLEKDVVEGKSITEQSEKDLAESGQASAIGGITGGVIGTPGAVKETVRQGAEKRAIQREKDRLLDEQYNNINDAKDLPQPGQEGHNPRRAAEAAIRIVEDEQATPEQKQEADKYIIDTYNYLAAEQAKIAAWPAEKKRDKKKKLNALQKINEQIGELNVQIDNLRQKRVVKGDELNQVIQRAAEGSAADIDIVKNNLLTDIESVTPEQMNQIINSRVKLPARAKKLLRVSKTTSEAITALDEAVMKSSADVHSDVLSGGRGFIGIRNYINNVSSALQNRNTEAANTQLNMLRTFAARHKEKVAAVNQAFTEARRGGISPETAARLQPYGLDIHRGSNNTGMIDMMNAEVVALEAAVKQVETMFEVNSQPAVPREENPDIAPWEDIEEAATQPEPTAEQQQEEEEDDGRPPWDEDPAPTAQQEQGPAPTDNQTPPVNESENPAPQGVIDDAPPLGEVGSPAPTGQQQQPAQQQSAPVTVKDLKHPEVPTLAPNAGPLLREYITLIAEFFKWNDQYANLVDQHREEVDRIVNDPNFFREDGLFNVLRERSSIPANVIDRLEFLSQKTNEAYDARKKLADEQSAELSQQSGIIEAFLSSMQLLENRRSDVRGTQKTNVASVRASILSEWIQRNGDPEWAAKKLESHKKRLEGYKKNKNRRMIGVLQTEIDLLESGSVQEAFDALAKEADITTAYRAYVPTPDVNALLAQQEQPAVAEETTTEPEPEVETTPEQEEALNELLNDPRIFEENFSLAQLSREERAYLFQVTGTTKLEGIRTWIRAANDQQTTDPVIPQETETAAQPEPQPEPAPEPAPAKPKKKSKNISPLRALNWIEEFFTKREPKEDVNNILQDYPDFLEALLNTDENQWTELFKDYFEDGITDAHVQVLRDVRDIGATVRDSINGHWNGKSEGFEYQDMALYFKNEDGVLNPEVMNAVILSVVNWLHTGSRDTLWNDDNAIRSILGMEDTDYISSALRKRMRRVGVGMPLFIESLGNDVNRILGYRAKDTAYVNMETNLINSLGSLAYGAMQNSGWVELDTLTQADLDAMDAGVELNVNQLSFVKVAYEVDEDTGQWDVHSVLRPYVDNYKEAKDTITSLVPVEKHSKGPSFEPITTVQKKIRRSSQIVSDLMEKLVRAYQKKPRYLRQNHHNIFAALSEQDQEYIAEIIDLETAERTLTTKRANGALAKAEQAKQSIRKYFEFIEDIKAQGDVLGLGIPFYFAHRVNRNNRVMMDSNTVNPLRDKLHRIFVGTSKPRAIKRGNNKQDKAIKVAIAEALGHKVDTTTKKSSIQFYNDAVKDPVIKKGYTAAKKMIEGDTSAKVKDDFMAAVRQIKGNPKHTFEALVGMAERELSAGVPDGTPGGTYYTTMLREVDGVTNGPIIGLMQLVASETWDDLMAKLNRGGIFFDKGIDTLEKWQQIPGNQDSYRTLATAWYKNIQKLGESEVLNSIEALLGSFYENGEITKTARDLAKYPLMTTIYGAGDASVIALVTDALMDSFYSQIEDAVAANDREAVDNLIEHMNVLIGDPRYEIEYLAPDESIDMALGIEPTNYQMKGIRHFVDTTYGQALRDAIDTEYGTFRDKRRRVNQMLEATHAMYKAQRDYLMDKRRAELIRQGLMEENVVDLPLADIRDIERQLQKSLPVIGSYFTDGSNVFTQGIEVAKTVKESTEAKGSRYSAFKQSQNWKFTGDAKGTNVYSSGYMRDYVSPGVAPTIMSIHGLDSATMMMYLLEHNAISVFDAIIVNAEDAEIETQALNKVFFEIMRDMSIAEEANKTLERAYQNYQDFLRREKPGKEYTSKVAGTIAQLNKANYDGQKIGPKFDIFMRDARDFAQEVTDAKNQLMEMIVAVDQYHTPDGEYRPAKGESQENTRAYAIAEARAKADAVRSNPSKPNQDSDKQIAASEMQLPQSKTALSPGQQTVVRKFMQRMLDNRFVNETTEQGKRIVNSLQKLVDENGDIMAYLRELSDPYFKQQFDREYYDNFGANPNQPTTYQLAIEKALREDGIPGVLDLIETKSQSNAMRHMAKLLREVLPANLELELLETAEEIGDFLNRSEALGLTNTGELFRGKYVRFSESGRNIVAFRTNALVHSGMTSATVLHELIHVATVMKIRENPDSRTVKRLRFIMEHASKQPGAQNFPNAFAQLEEFITHGLTRADFATFLANIYQDGKHRFNDEVGAIFEMESNDNVLAHLLDSTLSIFESTRTGEELYSSGHTVDMMDFTGTDPTEVNQQNSHEVFDNLARESMVQEDPDHNDYLRNNILGDIVNKVMGTINLFKQDREDLETIGMLSGDSLYMYNQITGTNPNISGSLAHGIRMSAQEVFVHELVHAITRNGLDMVSGATREVERLYNWVKDNGIITIQDLMSDPNMSPNDPNYADEYAAAKLRWEHVFVPKITRRTTRHDSSTDQDYVLERSNHLHEFLTLGVTNKQFINKLRAAQLPARPKFKGDNIQETLVNIFNAILNFFAEVRTGTRSKNVQQRLELLTKQIAGVENRKKSTLLNVVSDINTVASQKLNTGIGYIKSGVVSLANSNAVKTSRLATIQGAGRLVRLAAANQPSAVRNVLNQFRDRLTGQKYGFVQAMYDEITDNTSSAESLTDLHRLSNKLVDQSRKGIDEAVGNLYEESFETPMTDEDHEAMSIGLMKTDASSLFSRYTLSDIADFFDPRNSALNNRIQDELTELGRVEYNIPQDQFTFYRRAARALGYYMATGKVLEPHLIMNAYGIAHMHGVKGVTPQGDVDMAEDIVERLASLYAIQFTNHNVRSRTNSVIVREMAANPDKNGISTLMGLHIDVKAEAMERLFGGDPALMIKGYTKEIVNPHMSYVVAPLSMETELMKQNFVRQDQPLPQDPNDPNPPLFAYVSKDAGLSRLAAGIVSYSNLKAKGTDFIKIHEQNGSGSSVLAGVNDARNMLAARNVEMGSMFDPTIPDRPVFAQGSPNLMAPVINPDGDIVGYRYLMNERTKNDILEKNNNAKQVIGGMYAQIIDKLGTTEINRLTVQALYDQHQKDFSTRGSAYVEISAASTDPRLQEIWKMLPTDMREEVQAVWGRKGMLVRKDLVELVFGQRKYSIIEAFGKDRDDRTLFEHAIVMTGRIMGQTGAHKLRVAEEVMKELVKEGKDLIVVKTGLVTLLNTVSNLILLKMSGVPIKDIMTKSVEGFNAALEYQKIQAELTKLEVVVRANTDPANKQRDEQRIAVLKTKLANNPIDKLVRAGVMQSVVEDIDSSETTQYTYKSFLGKKFEPISDKLPTVVKTAGKWAYISHETKLYKMLNNAVRLSDFVARYALYEDRIKKGMPHDEAIRYVVRKFINYDLPTHRLVQYGNDVGLLWFTKYILRVQKVIVDTLRENPAESLMVLLLQAYVVGDTTDIFDSFLDGSNVLGTPLSGISAVTDTLTVESAQQLF